MPGLHNTLAALLIAGASLVSIPALADPNNTNGIALQLIGRNQVTGVTGQGAGTLISIGYLTAIEGVDQPLFSKPGTISEGTAHFTFQSENQTFATVTNGNSQVRHRTPGPLIRVYFNAKPDGANFDNPASFASGQLVAVLRLGHSQATRVDNTATSVDALEFVSSEPFTFGGKRINLRRSLRGGVTLFSTGPAVTVTSSGAGTSQFAFAGSAIRTGKVDND